MESDLPLSRPVLEDQPWSAEGPVYGREETWDLGPESSLTSSSLPADRPRATHLGSGDAARGSGSSLVGDSPRDLAVSGDEDVRRCGPCRAAPAWCPSCIDGGRRRGADEGPSPVEELPSPGKEWRHATPAEFLTSASQRWQSPPSHAGLGATLLEAERHSGMVPLRPSGGASPSAPQCVAAEDQPGRCLARASRIGASKVSSLGDLLPPSFFETSSTGGFVPIPGQHRQQQEEPELPPAMEAPWVRPRSISDEAPPPLPPSSSGARPTTPGGSFDDDFDDFGDVGGDDHFNVEIGAPVDDFDDIDDMFADTDEAPRLQVASGNARVSFNDTDEVLFSSLPRMAKRLCATEHDKSEGRREVSLGLRGMALVQESKQ